MELSQRPSVLACDYAFEEHLQKVRVYDLQVPLFLILCSARSTTIFYQVRALYIYVFRANIPAGFLLAYPIYSPTYSANSPYIRGTLRSSPQFLWACAAIWLVRKHYPTPTYCSPGLMMVLWCHTVRGTLQPVHSSDPAQPAPARHEAARDPPRLWLWTRLVPKLLF